MPTITKEKTRSSSTVVNEELQKMRNAGQPPAPQKTGGSKALGIAEIVAGVLVIAFSFAAGLALSIFLGAVLLVSGLLEVINGSVQRSMAHVVVGIIGALAGIYMLASPLVSLGIIIGIVGLYLLVSGVISAYRARQSGGSMTGGIIEALIGVLILFTRVNIGLLAGIYLIVRGIMTYKARPSLTKPAA